MLNTPFAEMKGFLPAHTMSYLIVTAYRFQKNNKEIIASGEVYLFKGEIYFPDRFGKTFQFENVGCKCEYFYMPKILNHYPNNCNVKIFCKTNLVVGGHLILYAKLSDQDIFDLKFLSQRLWISQPEFQKNMLIALLSGALGGVLTFLLLELIKPLV